MKKNFLFYKNSLLEKYKPTVSKYYKGEGISTAPSISIRETANINSYKSNSSTIFNKIRTKYKGRKLLWCESATESLKLALKIIENETQRMPSIAIPAYYCNEVITSIDSNCTIILYNSSDLIESIKKELSTYHIDAILLCNYFGEDNKLTEIKEIKEIFKGWLIKDNSHNVMADENTIDELEFDFVLISLYKHYPIRSGGCLIYKGKKEEKELLYLIKKSLANRILLSLIVITKDLLWIFKKIIQEELSFISRIEVIRENPFVYSRKNKKIIKKRSSDIKPMSLLSKYLINTNICNHKVNNKANKKSRLIIKSMLLWAGILNEDIIEKEYGLEVNTKQDNIEILKDLNRSGLPIMRWPELNKFLIDKSSYKEETLKRWKSKTYIICNSSTNKNRVNRIKRRFLNNIDLNIKCKSISDSKYNNNSESKQYNSYLQSITYMNIYGDSKYLFEIEYKKKVIGKFGVCLRKKYGLNIYIVNRLTLNNLEKDLPKSKEEYIYQHIKHSLRINLNLGIIIILPIENIITTHWTINLVKKILKIDTYKTGLLDLNKDKAVLEKEMKGRWRNALKKSMEQEIYIEIREDKKTLLNVANLYKKEKEEKNYSGINDELLAKWITSPENNQNKLFAVNAYFNNQRENESIGGALICKNDSTATYLLAFQAPNKRVKFVSNRILWESIIYSKEIGCKYFDLGGIDENKTPGVALFKLGLRPKIHQDGEAIITWTK